jgi:hypothetical protein
MDVHVLHRLIAETIAKSIKNASISSSGLANLPKFQ